MLISRPSSNSYPCVGYKLARLCNSLMHDLPQCQISELLRVQNAATRIDLDLSKFLSYNSDPKTVKPKSTNGLRSNNSTAISYTGSVLFTWCSLHCCWARALWNKLPADIRNVASLNRFKKSTKSFLFNKSLSTSFYFISI